MQFNFFETFLALYWVFDLTTDENCCIVCAPTKITGATAVKNILFVYV